MKKYTILALTLILCGSFLVGCGCTNGRVEPTTVPTVAPTKPTTVPTTAPTTAPTTVPTTAPTETTGDNGILPDGTGETADENGTVEPNGTDATDNARSRSRRIPPMG